VFTHDRMPDFTDLPRLDDRDRPLTHHPCHHPATSQTRRSPPDHAFGGLLSIDYMREIVRGHTADTVTLEASTDLPVIFEGDFADGAGRYEFMLAPRLNED
jgi:hypothetical protein